MTRRKEIAAAQAVRLAEPFIGELKNLSRHCKIILGMASATIAVAEMPLKPTPCFLSSQSLVKTLNHNMGYFQCLDNTICSKK